jgi:hypothetical protein
MPRKYRKGEHSVGHRVHFELGNVRPPQRVLDDLARRREIAATLADPNHLLLGDPIPGRSALDQRREGVRFQRTGSGT